MLLSEIDWPKTLTAAGALITVASLQISKMMMDYSAVKKNEAREEEKKQIQIEQRDCLRQLEKGQALQNGKLSTVTALNETHYTSVIEISKVRHEEILRAMQTSCKHTPVIVQQNNDKK